MTKRCTYRGCKKTADIWYVNEKTGRVCYKKYCKTHYYREHHRLYGANNKIAKQKRRKTTINGFLTDLYSQMLIRVTGKGNPKYRYLYKGKSIMPREVFYEWAKNHPDFLKLFKRWVSSGNDRKLVPTVNRINSSGGYSLDNVEWLTNSANCSLAGSVRHDNRAQIKAIRELVGVK